jgi:hypothetical protein
MSSSFRVRVRVRVAWARQRRRSRRRMRSGGHAGAGEGAIVSLCLFARSFLEERNGMEEGRDGDGDLRFAMAMAEVEGKLTTGNGKVLAPI